MRAMNDPITRQDLLDLEARLRADISALEERMSARFATKDDLAALEERMRQFTTELVHGVETKLLKAFFSFAERNEKVLERLATEIRALQASDQNLEERLRMLENRVFNIEKKLLQQPPAA